MIEIKKLIKNDLLIDNLKKKNFYFNKQYLTAFIKKIKKIKKILQKLQQKHNNIPKIITIFKKKKISINYFIKENIIIKKKIIEKKFKINYLEKKLNFFLLSIPNIIHKSVPKGKNNADNIEIRIYRSNINLNKNILKDFEKNNNYIDFDLSANISNTGFVILKKNLATLHRALGNYMIDFHINKNNYQEIYSPLIVNEKTMFNTGHFPKFYNEQFNIADTNLWLIPTSEVVLSNIVANKLISKKNLPIKLVSKTSCFRKEKGSYGTKVKGLIRQHQFEKVELLHIVQPTNSYNELEKLLNNAEKILQQLKLPYRIILLCNNDTGFTSSKTYDIEVWFPKRNTYIEVSSCSNTETFQSLRMNARFKKTTYNTTLLHILNGSGLAIGRILLALIENYSDQYGNIIIPKNLINYIKNTKIINISN